MIGLAAENQIEQPVEWESRRLWSLWDMLKVNAASYIDLGRWIADTRVTYDLDEYFEAAEFGGKQLNATGIATLQKDMQGLLDACAPLGLNLSTRLIRNRMDDPPQTAREYDLLVETLMAEMESEHFFYVEGGRHKYFDITLSEELTYAFPNAARELRNAGKCITFGMFTASVFHATRAVEIGVKAAGTALGVQFGYPIELAEWGKVVGEIEDKINELKAGPRSTQKDADLGFYSEAAAQFRHFNNAWRIRVSHARGIYDEQQARDVLEHSVSFFETLSTRLKEPV